MVKINTFTISILSFLLMFCAITSAADINNPFTIKGADEFTIEDRKQLEKSIKSEMNRKLLSLEEKLNKEIKNIKKDAIEGSGRYSSGGVEPSSNYNSNFEDRALNSSGFIRNNQLDDVKEEPQIIEDKNPMAIKVRKASFIGCIDDKVMFKDNRSKENFFVTVEEAKNNEEFSKMGDCSF